MAFIPVLSTAMVELFFRLDGQRLENVLYFRQAEAWEEAELLTLAGEVRDWYSSNVINVLSSDLSLVGVKATSLENDTAPAIEVSTFLPVSGGNGDAAIANNVALCIKFSTAGRGRSSRGRNYIPGIPNTKVGQNTVDNVLVAQLLEGYNALLLPETITEGAHCVVSRFQDNEPREFGLAQLVTGYAFTDQTVDSQRRRLPGRGT